MDRLFYQQLAERSLQGEALEDSLCEVILTSPEITLLRLLDAAFEVRQKFWGKKVMIHIINNAQNGHCPEDCHYCAQAKTSKADIEEYPLKSDAEILEEAKRAYESGAYRYCMVFAGRGPSAKRVEHLSRLIRKIKDTYPIRICLSSGLCGEAGLQKLKDAGLDRLNHNLNTSENFYPSICTTHTYGDRLNTLESARKVGIEICSGMIVGLGEKTSDLISVAKTLRRLESPSIPVNFLVPIEGNLLTKTETLTPQYCLRVLCLFRLLNPKAEIRAAAGREGHLRSLDVLSLYPANSIFLDGYLNTKGVNRTKVLRMIQDSGFTIDSEHDLKYLLRQESSEKQEFTVDGSSIFLKNIADLRPTLDTNLKANINIRATSQSPQSSPLTKKTK